MERGTLILVGVNIAIAGAVLGWLYSSKPLPPKQYSTASIGKPAISPADKKAEPIVVARKTSSSFQSTRQLNISITSGSQNAASMRGARADLEVNATNLKMRSGPGSSSPTVTQYPRGAKFVHIRDENGWALVQSIEDGQKGWMYKKYLTATN